MKKIIFYLIFVISVLPNTYSQISIGGTPYSLANKTKNFITPLMVLPELEMDKIKVEDALDEENGIPPRFGFSHIVDYNLNNSGKWHELSNGDRVWLLKIKCPNALSINLLYDKFWVPEEANFYIYNDKTTHIIGGFTNQNNKGTKQNPKGFGTGLVYGNTIVLEYFEPENVKGQGIISIARVVHGYRYINILSSKINDTINTESFGESGDCQVNINCSREGNDWQIEKRSVALILVNGNRYCTGSLINNTNQDGDPLFLTADHCLGGWGNDYHKYDAIDQNPNDGIDDPDLSHWSFYWNYESYGCNDGSDFIPVSTSGATVIANNSKSDFALLRLTEDPTQPPVEPYYNGWDRNNNQTKGGVGIHHPSGDIKKISTHNIVPNISNCYDSNNDKFWKINWIQTPNGHSVTEGGSSGSPLYNSEHRVIGQLYGSGPLCPNPNCSDPPNDIANYGRIYSSWNIHPNEPRRRLKDWLDPVGTDVMFFDGLDACPYYKDLTITDNIRSGKSKVYKSTNISANNHIENNATAIYLSDNKIRLLPGFEAESGSSFHADIMDICLKSCYPVKTAWTNYVNYGDDLCYYITNATSYEIYIYTESAELIHHSKGNISGNKVCVWNSSNGCAPCVFIVKAIFKNNCHVLSNTYLLLVGFASMSSEEIASIKDGKSIYLLNSDNEISTNEIITNEIENISDNTIRLYPNPNNGHFVIEQTGDIKETVYVEIRNVLGTMIYSDNIQSNVATIDISDKSDGMYIVKIIKGNKSEMFKILKE